MSPSCAELQEAVVVVGMALSNSADVLGGKAALRNAPSLATDTDEACVTFRAAVLAWCVGVSGDLTQ